MKGKIDFKNLDNQQKVILLVGPLVILAIIYFSFFSEEIEQIQLPKKSIDLYSVDVKNNEENSKKTKLQLIREKRYMEGAEREKKKKYTFSNNDFYNTDFASNSASKDSVVKTDTVKIIVHSPSTEIKKPVIEKLRTATKVRKEEKLIVDTAIQIAPRKVKRGFATLTPDASEVTTEVIKNSSTIKAVVHSEQQLKNNSVIRIRTLQESIIDGKTIPAQHILTGIATMYNDRVKVTIASIVMGNEIIPTNFEVWDIDGLEGIRLSRGINKEIAQDGVDQALSGTSINVPLPGIGSISTGGALRKKVNDPVVIVKNGHKVILKSK